MRHVKPFYQLLGCLAGVQMICTVNISAQNGYVRTAAKSYANQQYSSGNNSGGDTNDKQTLIAVLRNLNRLKGVYFLFSDETLGSKTVNPVKDATAPVEKILDDVLNNTGLKYKKVSDNTFVILDAKEKYRKSDSYNAASLDETTPKPVDQAVLETITGRITGPDGAPLVGVSISVKGTNKGTSTNSRGEFSIEANKGDVLILSYVGYKQQEVAVGNNNSLSISMVLSSQDMAEVVVVTALGIRKEAKRLGYSVTKVDGEGLTKAWEINVA